MNGPRPWGFVVAVLAAITFAAPSVVLPADSPVDAQLVFLAVGSVLFAGAIVLNRGEPARRTPPDEDEADDLTQ